jgi:DNA-binding NarL/FixJ family response regulator
MYSLLTTRGTIVNFRPDNVGPIAELELTKTSKVIQQALTDITGYDYVECDSFDNLDKLLTSGTVEVIECHASLPETCGVTVQEFVSRLKQLTNKAFKMPKLAVIVRHWTPAKIVNEFKEAGVDGLTVHGSSWSQNERCGSLNQILINGSHWPADIISALPQVDNRLLQIYFGSNYDQQFDLGLTNYVTKFCNNWRDLTGLLTEKPAHIVFHIQMTYKLGVSIYEFMSMIETLIKFVIPNTDVSISVAVDRDTHVDTIKEIKKTSAVGIIPSVTGFGKEETVKGIDAIMLHETYWPKHIISTLPGSVQPKARMILDKNSIILTSRQQEIFNLVARRGLSNKKIAQILNISESTVKVHISAILRSYKVRNRTQLALAGSILGLRA